MDNRKKKLEQLGEKLDPAVKSWIDNAIVPAMVSMYLAEKSKGKVAEFRKAPDSVRAEPSARVSV